ncbi:large ribosomal subunit protein bL35c [Malania oleifera]|uniref:large ribosomal subunit protein bL35c n=1 Tax=Malania oleifera TaxID=397392 RepID=UPI0025AE4655|nr:large ribosomal subunit protein bL35c [Malania oleifera]
MASAVVTLCSGLSFSQSSSLSSSVRASHRVAQLKPFCKMNSLKLSSSHNISGPCSVLTQRLCTISPPRERPPSPTVFATKGYKMKTHKASAKRFRVTGNGKIVRRGAGKQHLLYKKSKRRKLRLSKMHPVSRRDYGNVTGAMPYLKVNRQAK